MIIIKDLLSKFDHLIFSETAKRSAIVDVLYEIVGIRISPKDIKIKNNFIYLDIKPIYKSEILLIKKEKIFLKLKEKLGSKFYEKII